MDETLLVNKSIVDNSMLPNLQDNLLALDLMRNSDSGVIENETMLVKYSPETSVIKSVESNSFLNNTTLENLFPRGCQDNKLWAKSFKSPLNLSKIGNSSMDETLKSPKNSMKSKFENKRKMDLTVNLTFNDTDKEMSLCESVNKTNPFRKPSNCKKYSVNLNFDDTTQLSPEILTPVSSTENSLLTEKFSGNIFKTLQTVKNPPVIDLTLTESSGNEENSIFAPNKRRSKRYSLKCDLDSSCDSLKRKTIQINTTSNSINDEQTDSISNKKVTSPKETTIDEDNTQDKENQSFQMGTKLRSRRRNKKVCLSSQRLKIKNSNKNFPTDVHKISDSIVNSKNDDSQTAENIYIPVIECVKLSSQMNTGHENLKTEKEKRIDHKAEDSQTNGKKSLEINIKGNNDLEEGDQTITHEKAQSLLDNSQNTVEKSLRNCLIESNFEISTNIDDSDETLKDSLNPREKSKEHSTMEVEQCSLVVKQNTNIGESLSDNNNALNLEAENGKMLNNSIKENILNQSVEDENVIISDCPDGLTNDTLPGDSGIKNVHKNKRKKSASIVNDVTMNVSLQNEISSVSQEFYSLKESSTYSTPTDKSPSKNLRSLNQDVKCTLKKDSMEYLQTHIMDVVQNDGFDLYDCRCEKPELLEKNDSFSVINSLENCSDTFFQNKHEENNDSRVEISYLSKTIGDEFDPANTETNLVVENQKENVSLITSSLKINNLQDENKGEMVISTSNKRTIDDNNEDENIISNEVKTPSCSKPSNSANNEDSQTEKKESENDCEQEEQQKTPKTNQNFANASSLVHDVQHPNGTSHIVLVETNPEAINDKLTQKDVTEGAKVGEQQIIDSKLDDDSLSSGKLKRKSVCRTADCSISADDGNSHVTIPVENTQPSKDNSFDFAIPSLPSKRVSLRKSKTNEDADKSTPAKMTRSSTRKSNLSDKSINLSEDISLDVSSINQSRPHKKLLIYHSTPFHKVPVKKSSRKVIKEDSAVSEVSNIIQRNSRRITRSNMSIGHDNSSKSTSINRDKSPVNEQSSRTMITRSKSRSWQINSLLESRESLTVSEVQSQFDTTSLDSDNSLNVNNKSITVSQSPHLDPIDKHMLKIKNALNKNKRKRDSVFNSKELTPKKKKVVDTIKLPKLFKPAKWVDKRLYQFLEKSLSQKYKLEVRKVSEEFVITLYHTYTLVIQGHNEPSLSNLKTKLKELGLCHTQLDFFLFVINYMPFNFRKLVLPIGGVYSPPIQPKILPFDEL